MVSYEHRACRLTQAVQGLRQAVDREATPHDSLDSRHASDTIQEDEAAVHTRWPAADESQLAGSPIE